MLSTGWEEDNYPTFSLIIPSLEQLGLFKVKNFFFGENLFRSDAKQNGQFFFDNLSLCLPLSNFQIIGGDVTKLLKLVGDVHPIPLVISTPYVSTSKVLLYEIFCPKMLR